MIELFTLAIRQPLHALVMALCLAVTATAAGLFTVQKAQAVMQEKQSSLVILADKLEQRQSDIFETVIRIDENVKGLKENK